MLSTHYLQEVEAACSRILVIDRGRIVADGTRDDLVGRLPAGPLVVTVRGDAAAARALSEACGSGELAASTGDRHTLRVSAGGIDENAVARRVLDAGLALVELTRVRPSLEDAFRQLTTGPDRIADA